MKFDIYNRMKKLFENISGNRFKLLTESIKGQENVVSGLKKVFSSGLNEISYKRVEAVGLGYIKDVSTAQRISLEEAKQLAESFGYKDDAENAKFIKNEEEDISVPQNSLGVDKEPEDISNPHNKLGTDPEGKREVQIVKEIKNLNNSITIHLAGGVKNPYAKHQLRISELCDELLKLHGNQS